MRCEGAGEVPLQRIMAYEVTAQLRVSAEELAGLGRVKPGERGLWTTVAG